MGRIGLYVVLAISLALLAIGLLVASTRWDRISFRHLVYPGFSTELGLPRVDKNICPR